MKNQTLKQSVVHFKHWTRKKYSVYNSLSKSIKICTLTLAISLLYKPAVAQERRDSTSISKIFEMEEVVITAQRTPVEALKSARIITCISREEILSSTGQSLADLLENVAGVDIRQRGNGDMQSDISIRGGTFEQVLILLNGVSMNDPQTGHHHFNLPINIEWIERIEILKGPAARLFGPNAFNGVINIITLQAVENEYQGGASFGSFKSGQADAAANISLKNTNTFAGVSYSTSDGYTENTDYKHLNAFFNSRYSAKKISVRLQGGIGNRAFGANSFYTPKYPEQFEQTQVKFIALNFATETKIKLSPQISLRQHDDEFQLFRNESPVWYKNHNYHTTEIWSLSLPATFNWRGGITSAGFDFRSEKVLSNVLGDIIENPIAVSGNDSAFYTRSKTRQTKNFYAEHIIQFEKLNIAAGVLLSNNNFLNIWKFYPGIDISYQLNRNTNLFSNFSKSLRMPSFTDLYYQSSTIQGNINLLPEEAFWYEAGFKYRKKNMDAYASLFRRDGRNMIDWVKKLDEEIWHAENLTSVNITGIEIGSGFKLPGFNKINISYTYMMSEKNSDQLQSKYVLDHIRHKADIKVSQTIWTRLSAIWNISIQERKGKHLDFIEGQSEVEKDYPVFALAGLRLNWTTPRYTIFTHISNLLNQTYFDHSNVPEPGIQFMTGIRFKGGF